MKNREYFLLAAFIAVFLLTRLPRLGSDAVNTDAPLWHERSEAFVKALKSANFEKTYQKYHPGVTLMWVSGTAFEAVRSISDLDVGRKFYNFEIYDYAAKVFLVASQLGLSLVAIYLLSKIFDFNKAVLIMAVLSLEPFFVANSRFLHLDALFTLLLFNGLLATYLSFKEFEWKRAVFAGIFLAAAFLTKSLGILALGFVLIYGIYSRKLRTLGILTAAFFLATILMFPAMWVRPIQTLSLMFNESRVVGFEKGHTQIFFGTEVDNPGPLFYSFVFLLKLSPVLLFSGAFFYLSNKKSKHPELLTFLGLFYLIYFLIVTIATKKIDRYVLPMFPIFAIWFVLWASQLSKKYLPVIIFSVLAFQILPLFTLFPHYFTYTSPIFLSPGNANKIIGQKSFGVGVYDLRDLLVERYPNETVAISDEGPLKEIYGSFRVFDVWKVNPRSYDLLILGPNVEMPEIVGVNGRKFSQIDSLYIGGLEYWRIYR